MLFQNTSSLSGNCFVEFSHSITFNLFSVLKNTTCRDRAASFPVGGGGGGLKKNA